MDFLTVLLAYAQSHDISREEVLARHANYCQNLYWQPDASEKLEKYWCDIHKTWEEILGIKSGKY